MNVQNNNNNKKKGKGYLAPAVILFALLSVIGEIGEMERPEALIAVIVGAVILVVILATVSAVKKHGGKTETAARRSALEVSGCSSVSSVSSSCVMYVTLASSGTAASSAFRDSSGCSPSISTPYCSAKASMI